MKQILSLSLIFIASISISQSPYKRQQSAGEIPNDLTLSIKQKIEIDKLENGERTILSLQKQK